MKSKKEKKNIENTLNANRDESCIDYFFFLQKSETFLNFKNNQLFTDVKMCSYSHLC